MFGTREIAKREIATRERGEKDHNNRVWLEEKWRREI
jgi:hypothetical protein